MMNNLLKVAAIATMFSTSAVADTTFVNTGSDSGGFNTVLNMLNKSIDGDFIQAGNPVLASSHFDKGNVVTMWSTEWPGDSSLPKPDINADTIIALQTYETVMCSRKFTSLEEMSGTVKVATWGDAPAVNKFLSTLGFDNGIKFEVVPYEGSGGTTRGYLGGDADTIFTIQTRQSKIETDGKCFAFSANGDLDFAFIDIILSVNASPENVTLYRDTVNSLSSTEAWLTSFEGTVTYVVDDTNAEDIVSKTNNAIKLNIN